LLKVGSFGCKESERRDLHFIFLNPMIAFHGVYVLAMGVVVVVVVVWQNTTAWLWLSE